MPGACVPKDFGHDQEKVVKALASGLWCIDWWESKNNPLYFVRAAIKGYECQLFHGTWGGECTFLDSNGCRLTLKDRPIQCRLLEPSYGDCISHAPDKFMTAMSWRAWDQMFRAMNHYNVQSCSDNLNAFNWAVSQLLR